MLVPQKQNKIRLSHVYRTQEIPHRQIMLRTTKKKKNGTRYSLSSTVLRSAYNCVHVAEGDDVHDAIDESSSSTKVAGFSRGNAHRVLQTPPFTRHVEIFEILTVQRVSSVATLNKIPLVQTTSLVAQRALLQLSFVHDPASSCFDNFDVFSLFCIYYIDLASY